VFPVGDVRRTDPKVGLTPKLREPTERNLAPIQNNATYLGWVEGFRAGFTVHDELLGVPEKGQDGLHAPWSNRRSNHSRNEEIHR